MTSNIGSKAARCSHDLVIGESLYTLSCIVYYQEGSLRGIKEVNITGRGERRRNGGRRRKNREGSIFGSI